MSPILHAVVAVHVASLLAGKRHRGAGPDLLTRTGRTLATMRAGRVNARVESKPRRWRKLGPHEYTLRMGPVTIGVSRYYTARDQAADRWEWKAVVRATPRPLYIAGRTYGVDGAPLAQCRVDAVTAVGRWRDGIR